MRAEEQGFIEVSLAKVKQVRRLIAGAVTLAFLVVSLLALLAWSQRNQAVHEAGVRATAQAQAETQRQIALARQLAAQAIGKLEIDPELGLLLAIEAAQTAYPTIGTVPFETEHALHQALLASRWRTTLPHDEIVTAVAFSPNGDWITSVAGNNVHLWDVADKTERITIHHDHRVLGVAFTPDGRYLTTYGEDNNLYLWEVPSGIKRLTLPHGSRINAVAFSSVESWVITADDSGAVRLWDITSGAVLSSLFCESQVCAITNSAEGPLVATANLTGRVSLRNLISHEQSFVSDIQVTEVQRLVFDQSGHRLVIDTKDQKIIVWDVLLGKQLALLPYQSGEAGSIAINPDGTHLAIAKSGHSIAIWDLVTGTRSGILLVQGMTGYSSGYNRIGFSPNGKELIVSTDSLGALIYASFWNTASLWNSLTGQHVATFPHMDAITTWAFSYNGEKLATAGRVGNRGTVHLWDTRASEFASWNVGPIRSATISPMNDRLAIGQEDGTVHIWDVKIGRHITTLIGHTDIVYELIFNRATDRLVTISADDTTRLWDAATGRQLVVLLDQAGWEAVAFSPMSDQLVVFGNGIPQLWDSSTGKPMAELDEYSGNVLFAEFSPDGTSLAAVISEEGEVVVFWNVATGKVSDVLSINIGMCGERHGGAPSLNMDFSPDGSRLAVVGRESALLWKVSTSRVITLCGHDPLPGHGRVISDVKFSPDSAQLATAGYDGTARLWDASTGEMLAVLGGHSDRVVKVAFSPNGKRLATASYDGTTRLWDVASKQQITIFETLESVIIDDIPGNAMTEIAFSSDGRLLTTVSKDGTVKVYYTHIEDLMNLACTRLSHNLNHEEWERFLPDEPYHPTCPNLPVPEE
ncbi:MAG: hypothetical protein HS126_40180 [Anaerolineales bacterium]|nr:hypothetical protein [Anaerolineales bacterium]